MFVFSLIVLIWGKCIHVSCIYVTTLHSCNRLHTFAWFYTWIRIYFHRQNELFFCKLSLPTTLKHTNCILITPPPRMNNVYKRRVGQTRCDFDISDVWEQWNQHWKTYQGNLSHFIESAQSKHHPVSYLLAIWVVMVGTENSHSSTSFQHFSSLSSYYTCFAPNTV